MQIKEYRTGWVTDQVERGTNQNLEIKHWRIRLGSNRLDRRTQTLTRAQTKWKVGNQTNPTEKWGQFKDRHKEINDVVEKLVNASIVRESLFGSWVANPLLVKKGDEQWMMCINVTDFSKACPKDYYLLPYIDDKIELLHRHKLKSFLDAYKVYYLIHIHKEEEEKNFFPHGHGHILLHKNSIWIKKCRGNVP